MDEARVPYSVERKRRHIAIRVGGKMAGIVPLGGRGNESAGRAVLNVRSQVRRAVKEWKAAQV